MRRVPFGLAILAVGILSGCMQSTNVEQERAALLAADKAWSASGKDTAKYVSFFASDATVHTANMQKVSGPQAIEATMKQMMAIPGFDLQWSADRAEVSASGDIGYTSGTYKATMTNAAG